MRKAVTKITRTKNESEHIVKKAAIASMMTTRKKIDDTNRKRKKTKLRIIFDIELLKKIEKISENLKSKIMKLK